MYADTQYNSEGRFRFHEFKTINGKALPSSSPNYSQSLHLLHKRKRSLLTAEKVVQDKSSRPILRREPSFAEAILTGASNLNLPQVHCSEVRQDSNLNVNTPQISIEPSIEMISTYSHHATATKADSVTNLKTSSVFNSLTRK